MAVSKAAKAQQKRRKFEKEENSQSRKKSSPINISSSSRENTPDVANQKINENTPGMANQESDGDEDSKIEDLNRANNALQYMQASRDDVTTDEELSDEDDNQPLDLLWPIFSNNQKAEVTPAKQKLKSGKSGYKKPVKNPLSSSGKLIPRPLPRQTKHEYAKKRKNALGENNNIMQQFLIPQKKIVEPPNPPPIISIIVDEQQTLVDPSILQESLELRVATQVNRYLSLPKNFNPKPDT